MNSVQKVYSKLKWTPEQEELLRTLKQEKQIQSWKKIAFEMNQRFMQKNRSGKQCRERYMNYVRFGKETPKMCGWTPEQDELLFLKFMEHGAKWVQIGKQMPGRSENCLKNRFYGAMRKIIRKINRAAKQKKIRQKKPIKTDLLIRILEHPGETDTGIDGKLFQTPQFLEGLKKQMIKIAINPEQNSSSDEIEYLINNITKFCAATKNSKQKRSRNVEMYSNFQQNLEEEQQQQSLVQSDKPQSTKSKQNEEQNRELHVKIINTLILFCDNKQNQKMKQQVGARLLNLRQQGQNY